MDLKGILSISGQSGLYKMVSQAKNGIIVESLETQKRIPAYATSKISALEDIAIFCEDGDIQLTEVFKKIYQKENGGQAINPKSSNEELKKYFAEVLPNFDKEKVYVSDIKRVMSWYNQLNEKGLIDLEEKKDQETSTETNTTENSDNQ